MKYVGIRKENNLYKILESNDFQDIKGFELLHSRGEIRSYDYEIEDVLFSLPQTVIEVIHHYSDETLKRYDQVIEL